MKQAGARSPQPFLKPLQKTEFLDLDKKDIFSVFPSPLEKIAPWDCLCNKDVPSKTFGSLSVLKATLAAAALKIRGFVEPSIRGRKT
jgi:hypothetical protein